MRPRLSVRAARGGQCYIDSIGRPPFTASPVLSGVGRSFIGGFLLGCCSLFGRSAFFVGSGVLPMMRTSFVLCPVGVTYSYVIRGMVVPARWPPALLRPSRFAQGASLVLSIVLELACALPR